MHQAAWSIPVWMSLVACVSAVNDGATKEAPVPVSRPAPPAAAPAATPATASPRADVPDDINDGWIAREGEAAARTLERDGREVYAARAAIMAAIGVESGQAVADVGSGSGLFTRLFSDAVGPTGTVYAVDIGEKMLAYIAEKAKETGRTNIKTVLGTAYSTRLPPASVDLVFISDTYHHFEYPQDMMRSIRRALRPDGRVVLIDFIRIEGTSPSWILGHVRAGQEVFEREIQNEGFSKTQTVELDQLVENYFVVFKKSAPAAVDGPS